MVCQVEVRIVELVCRGRPLGHDPTDGRGETPHSHRGDDAREHGEATEMVTGIHGVDRVSPACLCQNSTDIATDTVVPFWPPTYSVVWFVDITDQAVIW